MNTDAEHSESESTGDKILAQHQRFAEVLLGKRPLIWSDWAIFIDESTCLTPKGQQVARWAVDTLQQTLRDDFFQRITTWLARMRGKDAALAPDWHPVFSLGFWPVNDVPWVYANLIRLAVHIHLFNRNRPDNKIGHVLKMLRNNLEPISWMSILLQLEVAGLGLRAGWDILFEPGLGNNRSADVYLTKDSTHLFVETALMRMSVAERRALSFSQSVSQQLDYLEFHYGMMVPGNWAGQ